jgi:hypothetical protein
MTGPAREIADLLIEQNAKLDQIRDDHRRLLEHGTDNFRRYRRRAYAMFAVLTIASTAALYWLWSQSHQIQTEREQSIRTACVDQNARHRATVAQLDARLRLAVATASPAQARQIRQSRAFTVALIDALAPVRDCDAVVRRSVRAK